MFKVSSPPPSYIQLRPTLPYSIFRSYYSTLLYLNISYYLIISITPGNNLRTPNLSRSRDIAEKRRRAVGKF